MIRGEPAKHKIYSLSLQSFGVLHYTQDVRDHHLFFSRMFEHQRRGGVRILIVCLKV